MRKQDMLQLNGLTVRQALNELQLREEIRIVERNVVRAGTAEHIERNIATWNAERRLRSLDYAPASHRRGFINPVLP